MGLVDYCVDLWAAFGLAKLLRTGFKLCFLLYEISVMYSIGNSGS